MLVCCRAVLCVVVEVCVGAHCSALIAMCELYHTIVHCAVTDECCALLLLWTGVCLCVTTAGTR
jgi:hypothetical protein